MRRRTKGLFVVLEGIDGAGTTTQAQAIRRALEASGVAVHVTCEPSGGPIGRLLRDALAKKTAMRADALALLFAADRLHHLAHEVEPALERGELVLSDRYVLSSLAYQGSELPSAWVESINARARPADLTLFFEVSPSLAARRREMRGGRAELFDDELRQARIARKYREVVRRFGRRERVVRIDGSLAVEEVTQLALEAIWPLLGRRRGRR